MNFKKQADELIAQYSLKERNVIPTGSYFLDLMVCPDLDLYFESITPDGLFNFAQDIYSNKLTDEITIMKGDRLNLPGDHIQVRTNLKNHGIAWKIDIWFFHESYIAEKQVKLLNFKKKLNPQNMEEIKKIKISLVTPRGFTPKYSSYHVYDAFLNHGLRSLQEIKTYLTSVGINWG